MLLAEVFLRMTGGQNSLFEGNISTAQSSVPTQERYVESALTHKKLHVVLASDDEQQEHAKYLAKMEKKGACVLKINESSK